MTAELEAISEAYFNEKGCMGNSTSSKNYSTTNGCYYCIVPLRSEDAVTVQEIIDNLHNAEESEWVNQINDLINQVDSFNLDETNKNILKIH